MSNYIAITVGKNRMFSLDYDLPPSRAQDGVYLITDSNSSPAFDAALELIPDEVKAHEEISRSRGSRGRNRYGSDNCRLV